MRIGVYHLQWLGEEKKVHLVLSLYPLLTGNNTIVTAISNTTNRAITSDTLEDLY